MQTAMKNVSFDCDNINQSLEKAFEDTRGIVSIAVDLKRQQYGRIAVLTARRLECDIKKQITVAFLACFTLDPAEVRMLTHSGMPINKDFFDALSHLQKIHQNCNVLLIAEQQRTGLDIMEKMNGYQEIAYERLFRWTQHECRAMKFESPEVSGEFKRAMHAFRLRPILFDACIDEIASIRNQALTKAFYSALSVGGPGGIPKPIDFHAHDPLRYSGDILAWIHQACVGEREMLEGVFGIASKADRRRSSVTMPEAFQGIEGYKASEDAVLKVLDRNTEGLCSILMKRIDSLFSSTLSCLLAFRICNMCQFYAATIQELLGPLSMLTHTLEKVGDKSLAAFQDSLKYQASDLLRTIPSAPSTLEVPSVVRECIAQLKEILVSYDMSLVATTSGTNERDQMIDLIFESFVNPILTVCQQSASELSSLEGSIYLVNCYHLIQTSLSAFTGHTEEQVEKIEKLISNQIGTLVEEQFRSMLLHSGLAGLLDAIGRSKQPLGLDPATDKQVVARAMADLNRFLLDVNMDVTENLYRISSVDISKRVASRGRVLFLEAYRDLVQKIHDPKNKYEFPASLVGRSPEEVEILLADE
ncbi:Golgi transport complex subunit 6 [Kappamyces sp. JEL0680]|nr:Golgi transport complex subunit 6 [Kappamyces sp. JEL0680]